MSARRLQQTIHVACRQLGLDSDARRDVQLAACGKASMRDMDEADLNKVLSHLKDRGFKPTVKRRAKGGFHKPAPRGDLRLVHVLWRKLGEAGVLREPSRKGLNAFIRSRYEGKWDSVPLDVDMIRDPKKIASIIRALREWCARDGVALER